MIRQGCPATYPAHKMVKIRFTVMGELENFPVPIATAVRGSSTIMVLIPLLLDQRIQAEQGAAARKNNAAVKDIGSQFGGVLNSRCVRRPRSSWPVPSNASRVSSEVTINRLRRPVTGYGLYFYGQNPVCGKQHRY